MSIAPMKLESVLRAFTAALPLVLALGCGDRPQQEPPSSPPPPSMMDASSLPPSSLPGASTLSSLRFAIVGDSRPASNGDTSGYPTPIITQIWQDIAAEAPEFVIGTGDYMYARYASDVNAQLDLYLGARAAYTGAFYPVMGNHECTGGVSSNCGPGSRDGMTANYQAFLGRMLGPIGQANPYYAMHFQAQDGSWTAKLVFLAANAWSDAQAQWLDQELSIATTYTFVVRHEGTNATTAMGVTPSGAIIARHPLTLLLVGHSHTFAYYTSSREVVTGNGGAPLTGSVPYGYVIVDRRDDGTIEFSAKNYMDRQAFATHAVDANGNPAR
jgi:hypothetical protein